MTTVIVNDYVLNRRVNIVLDANDFAIADRLLASPEPDELLLELQHLDTFKGRTRVADLEPWHLRVMVTMNLAKVPPGESFDLGDPIVRSLLFLIATLIRCLERRADGHIEMLKLNRVGEHDLTIEFSGLLSMEDKKPKKRKRGISLVVDNT